MWSESWTYPAFSNSGLWAIRLWLYSLFIHTAVRLKKQQLQKVKKDELFYNRTRGKLSLNVLSVKLRKLQKQTKIETYLATGFDGLSEPECAHETLLKGLLVWPGVWKIRTAKTYRVSIIGKPEVIMIETGIMTPEFQHINLYVKPTLTAAHCPRIQSTR